MIDPIKKPLSKRDLQRAKTRMRHAREALKKCTEIEQAEIFREMGRCACSMLANVMKKEPSIGIGALIGAVVVPALMEIGKKPGASK